MNRRYYAQRMPRTQKRWSRTGKSEQIGSGLKLNHPTIGYLKVELTHDWLAESKAIT